MNSETEQLTMFIADLDRDAAQEAQLAREEAQRRHWRVCWGWTGPSVGQPCSIDSITVERESGGFFYAYMERCMILEKRPDGRWLAEIAMGLVWGKPWPKDGTRILLSTCDIWPPVSDLRKARDEATIVASLDSIITEAHA
jgi:hypothetical protein